MNLNITNLVNEDDKNYNLFMKNLNSKLTMDFVKNGIIEISELIMNIDWEKIV